MQEPSSLLKMSEHLTDSYILQSRKSYAKKKDYRNLSISCENGVSFSATVSEELKNNDTSLLSNYTEEVYAEEMLQSVTDNCSENSSVQNGSDINSEICLFNDEDTDFYFSVSAESPRYRDSSPIPEASSSGSNYQRTRKNLKNRLSNLRYSSEEMSDPMSHEENSNSLNDSKSTTNFFKLKQAPSTKQNYVLSINDQAEHARDIKSPGVCVNKLPQNQNIFHMANQAGKISNKGTMLQNPSKTSSKVLSIVNLVNKYAASSQQAPEKKNICNKRKRNKKECELIPAKKTVVTKHSFSSKVNSVENSAISVKNYSKSTILKSDVINTVSYQGALNKGNAKTPSKAVRKGNNTPVDSTERSIQILQKFISKNSTVNSCEKTKVKRAYSSRHATSDLHLVSNEATKKIQSYNNGGKQIDKPPEQSEEFIVLNQAVNNITEKNFVSNFERRMPLIIAPNPPISQNGATPLFLWSAPPITYNSIQSDNHAIPYENCEDLSIPGPSTLNNDYSSLKANDYYAKNVRADETITSTTIINQNGIGCNQPNYIFRPRTHVSDGISFQQFMAKSVRNIENNCILKCKERSNETFLKNPSWLDITVQEFFDTPTVIDALLDYINELDMDNSAAVHNPNKGYDFPENFESENLLRVVKDFVHTAISYIIPTDSTPPSHLSYSRIANSALLKMSSREFVVLTHVFRKSDNVLKLKDVLSRLSLVALFVLFDEYNNKIKRSL